MDMNFNIQEDIKTEETSIIDVDFSELETDLRDYVIKQEVCASMNVISNYC